MLETESDEWPRHVPSLFSENGAHLDPLTLFLHSTVSKNASNGVGTVLVIVGAVLACVVRKSEQNWRGFEA